MEIIRKQDPHEQLGIFIVAGVAVWTSRKVVLVGIVGRSVAPWLGTNSCSYLADR